MKKLLNLIIFNILISIIGIYAQTNPSNSLLKELELSSSIQLIDINDSIIIDFDLAVFLENNHVDIPIYIKSDDDIHALDFSLKFNQNNILYDTIINFKSEIQKNDFYNPNDNILRFTSNSFLEYEKDGVKLFSIRFKLLNSKMTLSDLFSMKGYLNGESCTFLVKAKGDIILNATDIKNSSLVISPNPANDHLMISGWQYSEYQIIDLNSKIILLPLISNTIDSQVYDVSLLQNGVYFLRIISNSQIASRSFIICH